jgi:hypothetical protein
MSEGPWKQGWEDWSGRGWLVRSVCLPLIGFGIGWFLGPRLMAHYPAWVPGLIGAVGAPLIWAVLTLSVSLLKSPGKVLKERDNTIQSRDARIRELELTRDADFAKRPNLNVEILDDGPFIARMKICNAGGAAERMDIKVDSDDSTLPIFRTTQEVTGSGHGLGSGSEHIFEVATFGSKSGNVITAWRLKIGGREHPVDFSSIPTRQELSIRVSVTCRPANQDGPIQWQLTFHRSGFKKEQITPPPGQPPAGPPSPTASA